MAELITLMRERNLTVPKLHSKLLISGVQVSRNTLKSWVYKKRNPKPHTLAKIISVIAASEARDEHQLVEFRREREHGRGRCLCLVVKGLDRSQVTGEKLWVRPFLRPGHSVDSAFTGDRLPVTSNVIFRRNCKDVALFDRIFAFCGDDAVIVKVAVEREGVALDYSI